MHPLGSHGALLAPLKDNPPGYSISELSFYANKTVTLRISERHDALWRIGEGFDDLLQIGNFNSACVVHGPL